ncbi:MULTISPECIES: class I SAM-dependent methyltransferase [unclassified Sulfitobacter]|nr:MULTISPECIES: class I SAM-dependent methyltransferase [unclassified Sulfitobacter]KZY25866.1 hypothetical protein A3728_17750 [Sulfitobacter sp. HI0040]KZZ66467.1 hypothetical protein A3764_16920 [Sulfitobacter sp. HI0129]
MTERQDNSEQQEFWSRLAGPKWVDRQETLDVLFQPVLDAVLEAAELRPGDDVLDVGCGTGASTIAAARAIGSGSAVGIDIAGPLLDRARERAAASDLENMRFLHADAAAHDFGSERFDRLISRFGVMFFADPVAAFANLRQALQPGARLSLGAWGQIPQNPFFTLPARLAKAVIGPTPKSDPDAPGPFAFRDPERVEAILTQAGFADVACDVRQIDLIAQENAAQMAVQMCDIGPAHATLRHYEASEEQKAALQAALEEALHPFEREGRIRIPAEINIYTARNA